MRFGGTHIALGSFGQLETKYTHAYIDILVEDEGEDGPEGEYGGIPQLQVGVEDRYGNVVKDAGKDELND